MTLSEREELMRDILESVFGIMKNKGHDYSGPSDCWSNISDFGWQGILVRLGDKYHRLKNFVLQNNFKVSDETVEDTMQDLIAYSLLLLARYKYEKGSYTKCAD